MPAIDVGQLRHMCAHLLSHRIYPDSPGDNEEAITPKLLVAAFLLNVGPLSAVELRGVVVESTEGIFLINNLKVDGSGTDQSFRVKWNGSITNNTGKEWHKVTFCGKGFEAEDKPLRAAGEPCLLRLWMYAWKHRRPDALEGVGEDAPRGREASCRVGTDEVVGF